MTEIVMLGTGNAMCTRCYNTCFYLRTDQGGMLVDAGGGNGIFRQLHKARIAYEDIHHIFVTHCHTDHIMGAIWLIRKISPMMYRGRYEGTLTIYCHDEVRHALLTMCNLMIPQKILSAIGNTIILKEVTNGETLRINDMDVTFFDIGSSKTKQFGFQALLPDNQKLVCLGDEPYNPCAEKYARHADWLMAEAFCLFRDRSTFRPYEKHHSTAVDAGKTANELNAKNLILYHTEDTNLTARRDNYAAEAKTEFSGNIFIPNDLEIVKI